MQFLIDFHNDVSDEEITNYLGSFGATVLRVFSNFNKVYHVETDVQPPESEIVEFCINDDEKPIKLLSTTIIADQNHGKIVTDGSVPGMTVPNDEKNWWKFYSFTSPDLTAESYFTNRRGKETTVYVLDSGVDLTHPEFVGADISNLFSFTGDFTDTAGHGTTLSSLIVGNTCGITNSKLKSVKIFDQNVPTKQSDMLRGLDAIFDDVIQNQYIFSVVNCSWTISKNQYIEDKIRSMINAGILFVSASGNNGLPIEEVTPASMPEVITIGSYNHELKPSDFSNYTGTGISVTQGVTNHGALDGWAPGENIYAAFLNNSYDFMYGTSVAAAINTAVLAYNLPNVIENPREGVTMHDFGAALCLGRKDMLYLQDPKYRDSKNLISTIYDHSKDFGTTTPLHYHYSERENTNISLTVFNPHVITKLEVLEDLPAGFTITTTGILFGKLPKIVDRYDTIKIPMRATHNDGTVEDFDFTILMLAIDFDVDHETTGDPTLDIILTIPGCNSCYSTGIPGCSNNCPKFYDPTNFCINAADCPINKNQLYCYCSIQGPI